MRLIFKLLAFFFLSNLSSTFGRNPTRNPFYAVFIGNSLTGGMSIGGNDGTCPEPYPNPQPTPEKHNPGDVPSKVKAIADTACEFNFSWTQNSRSSFFLSDHTSTCLDVNQAMVANPTLQQNISALFIQAQSAELAIDTCTAKNSQVADLNTLVGKSSESAKKILYTSWAQLDSSTSGVKSELCTFSQINCTAHNLVSRSNYSVQVAPTGMAFRYIGEKYCQKQGTCTCMGSALVDTCGFTTASCANSLWSASDTGIFAPGQTLHQSEWAGAWMNALVLYSSLHEPVCLPPASLLRSLNVTSADILTEAAVYALTTEFGPNLTTCIHNLVSLED